MNKQTCDFFGDGSQIVRFGLNDTIEDDCSLFNAPTDKTPVFLPGINQNGLSLFEENGNNLFEYTPKNTVTWDRSGISFSFFINNLNGLDPDYYNYIFQILDADFEGFIVSTNKLNEPLSLVAIIFIEHNPYEYVFNYTFDNDDKFKHVVVSFINNDTEVDVQLFVNGVFIEEGTIVANIGTIKSEFNIIRIFEYLAQDVVFDEAYIFNRPLSEQEVMMLYREFVEYTPILIGDTPPDNIYAGTEIVQRIYAGSEIVYENELYKSI